MSRFKVQNDVTKMEFHIKMSRFSVKSRFKESLYADRSHSLNRDFTVPSLYVFNDSGYYTRFVFQKMAPLYVDFCVQSQKRRLSFFKSF